MAQALTSGEIAAAVYTFRSSTRWRQAHGRPRVAGRTGGRTFNTVVLKDSPHPYAAQVLADL